MVGAKRFQCYVFLFPTDFSPSNKSIIQSFLFLHAPSFLLLSHLCTAEGWLFGSLIGREVKKAQRMENRVEEETKEEGREPADWEKRAQKRGGGTLSYLWRAVGTGKILFKEYAQIKSRKITPTCHFLLLLQKLHGKLLYKHRYIYKM